MTSNCRIERSTAPAFDINTGFANAGTKTLIYTGICRVWEVTGSGTVVVSEESVYEQTTQISIPWDVSPIPIRGDYITITGSSSDTNLVNRVFEIQDQAKSGELRASRRFSVKLVQESS